MKKLVAISFVSAYLLSSSHIKELLKVSFMIEHYGEHKKQNPSISFAGFLVWHYLNNTSQQPDYKKDLQLPFKNLRHWPGSQQTIVAPEDPLVFTIPYVKNASYKYRINNEHLAHTKYCPEIFEPPRAT